MCALDVISEQRYSLFLGLFIKRMSQVIKCLQQLFTTLLGEVFVSLGQSMKKQLHNTVAFFACCIIKNLIIQVLGDKTPNNKISLLSSAHAEAGNQATPYLCQKDNNRKRNPQEGRPQTESPVYLRKSGILFIFLPPGLCRKGLICIPLWR